MATDKDGDCSGILRVIRLISKPPLARSIAEVDLLLPWLRKKSDLLEKLERDILIALLQNCTYKRTVRDDVIIKQGDKGDCFYIMLSGKTSVYIDTIRSDTEQLPVNLPHPTPDDTKPAQNPDKVDIKGFLESLDRDRPKCRRERAVEYDVEGQRTSPLDRTQFGKFIIKFDAGNSFGEIALMGEDAVRNASIIADEDTDLLVIDRALFNGTLKAKQEAEYLERRTFVRKSVLFRKWSSKFRRLCEMSLRKATFPFDSLLMRQGDPVVGLLFIIKGQGRVVVDPNMHRYQFPKYYDTEPNTDDLIRKDTRHNTTTKNIALKEHIRVRRREGYAAAERRLAAKTVTMCYVDESEILGDTELVLGLETYAQSIVCTANTQVLILDNKNIERLIQKKHPNTFEQLRQIVEDKLQSRVRVSAGSRVPLYSRLLQKLEDAKPRRLLSSKREDDDKPKSIAETIADRDVMMTQLSNMFIQDKAPFIEPSVVGSLYYLTKSKERAEKRAADRNQERKSRTSRTGEVQLQRARKAARRLPRSRRELERLTLGSEGQDLKSLQDNDHTVNKYYSTQIGGSRPKTAVELRGRSDGFFITEGMPEDSHSSGDQTWLGYRDIVTGSMPDIVHEVTDRKNTINDSRSKVICSMLERKSAKVSPLGIRPVSAPPHKTDSEIEAEEETESFDWETGNAALKTLENKLRAFYERSDPGKKKVGANVIELKRFEVSGPENVPIPGGTVYVRQRSCQNPGGAKTEDHQHVRRFIIPKDAYRVAVRSLSAVNVLPSDRSSSRASHVTRTRSASSRDRPGMTSQSTRIQSAPMTRLNMRS